MRVQYSKPVAGLSAIQSQTFHELFGEYEGRLVRARYHQICARLHGQSSAHFGVWIEREGHPLETINDQTLVAFERHRSTCRCSGTSRTLTSYGSYVGDLVRVLGDDPRTYTARGLRDFVEQRCRA